MRQNHLPNGKRVDQPQIGGEDIRMPTYTLRNKKTGETWEVLCSYDKMQEQLSDDVEHVLGTPNFVSMVGGTLSRTSTDFRDKLKQIKKHHPGSTIKT